ncbi:MAG: CaiB/BaiF CoA-transferase family protein [Pseudomonadota bacterium]
MDNPQSAPEDKDGFAGGDPPLKGLKVLELARVLAGPWAGQVLADLGATVIKVESPDGDETRGWGPPFISRDGDTTAAYFYACNRGKTSVAVDLKTAEGAAYVRELAADADVLIENFKTGGLVPFGLDFASVDAANPRIVYASITGFGQDGPAAHRPGYDYLLQAMSGLMSITGEPDRPPQKVGVAITDLFTGLYAVVGIQAALAERERSGKGQHIDLSLFDSATAMLANQAMNYLASGTAPGRMGNAHPNIAPYQVFDVSDGACVIAVGNDGQFARLCEVLGLAHLSADTRFATNAARVAHAQALIHVLRGPLSSWHRDELLAALESANVPASPINSVAEALNHPQIKARNMVIEPEDIAGLRTPLRFSRSELALGRSAPTKPGTTQGGLRVSVPRFERD